MLTRLEVNGFKNLVDFSVDFGPFTCITGPGGVGKSNLFDAIRFLSLLADHPINQAMTHVVNRGTGLGDIGSLFFFNGDERTDRFEIAAEMLIRRNVRDDFGREAEASSSFLRYELSFRYDSQSPDGRPNGGIVLEREELRPIIEARAARHLKFPHSRSRFRDGAVYNSRHARSGFISTLSDPESGQPVVTVHQDGGYPARGRPSLTNAATRTALGTENTVAAPTILAAKREMQGWQVLDLNPDAIRRPDRYNQRPGIGGDGAHIPATLHHWIRSGQDQELDPESALAELIASVSDVVPLSKIGVSRNDALGLLTLVLEEQSGRTVGPSNVSDSALRFLAIAALAHAPDPPALLCIEHPETGLEVGSLDAVNSILHQMAADPHQEIGANNPLRQVIAVSQSHHLLQLQNTQDLLLAQPSRSVMTNSNRSRHVLQCLPHTNSWRCSGPEDGIDITSIWSYPLPQQKLQIGFPSQFWNEP